MNRPIQPLGAQIIIRTIPQDAVGSILIPDSAKGITMMGQKGPMDAVHAVEAEVIAVGPGKRKKGDAKLLESMADYLRDLLDEAKPDVHLSAGSNALWKANDLLKRTDNQNGRVPILVKPGDRILYHPSVQRFDRDITAVISNGNDSGSKYFIIREDSVLAVIERCAEDVR